VRTPIGDVTVLGTEALKAEDKVLVSVRPEDVELVRQNRRTAITSGGPRRPEGVPRRVRRFPGEAR